MSSETSQQEKKKEQQKKKKVNIPKKVTSLRKVSSSCCDTVPICHDHFLSDLPRQVLTTNHVIVDRILNYLPVVELVTKQTVCKFWKDSTHRLMKTRRSPFQFFHYVLEVNRDRPSSQQMSPSPQRQTTTPSNSFGTSTKEDLDRIVSYYFGEMKRIFLSWRYTWRVLPEVLLLISKVDLSSHLHGMEIFLKFKAFLYESVPRSSTLILIRDSVKLHEKHNAYIHNNHLLLPRYSCSKVFSWSRKNWRSEEIGRDLIQGVDQYLTDNSSARLIVIFFNWDVTLEPIYQMEQDLFTLLADYTGRLSDMSVLGCCTMYPFSLSVKNGSGLGARKIVDSEFTVSPIFVAIAFSMNTFVASVTVNEDIDTTGGLYDKLRHLRDSVPLKVLESPNTYGIMITDLMRTSAGKWYSEYQADSFEASAFKQVFPNLPLAFSLCGNAQIGFDYNLNPPREERFVDMDEETPIHHIWTTIFAIVKNEDG